jgi:hypothetical protein
MKNMKKYILGGIALFAAVAALRRPLKILVMKNSTIFGLFILTAGSICCNSPQKEEKTKLDIPVETVDFNSLEVIESALPKTFVKEEKYILLDNSNDDFLFKSIYKMKMKNNRIFILDRRLKKLIVFNQDGKGIGTVGNRGQGPEEYLQIDDFDANDSGDIYLIDGRLDKLFVFDENFQFISVRKLPFEADIIHCLPDNKLMIGLSSWNTGQCKKDMVIITDAELVIEKSYMQYNQYIDETYWISNYIFVNEGKNILYNQPIDNYVYQFSETGRPVKAYRFDFGKKNVLNEDKKDIEGNIEKYKNYCCLKNFTIINDKYALGTLWDKTETKTFFIDRKNKKLYTGETIADADKSNVIDYYNNSIVSYIYPGKYEHLQTMDFPEEVKKYVEDENFVLCLSELY